MDACGRGSELIVVGGCLPILRTPGATTALTDAPPVRFAPAFEALKRQVVVCTLYEVFVSTSEGNVEPHVTIPVLKSKTPSAQGA